MHASVCSGPDPCVWLAVKREAKKELPNARVLSEEVVSIEDVTRIIEYWKIPLHSLLFMPAFLVWSCLNRNACRSKVLRALVAVLSFLRFSKRENREMCACQSTSWVPKRREKCAIFVQNRRNGSHDSTELTATHNIFCLPPTKYISRTCFYNHRSGSLDETAVKF